MASWNDIKMYDLSIPTGISRIEAEEIMVPLLPPMPNAPSIWFLSSSFFSQFFV